MGGGGGGGWAYLGVGYFEGEMPCLRMRREGLI